MQAKCLTCEFLLNMQLYYRSLACYSWWSDGGALLERVKITTLRLLKNPLLAPVKITPRSPHIATLMPVNLFQHESESKKWLRFRHLLTHALTAHNQRRQETNLLLNMWYNTVLFISLMFLWWPEHIENNEKRISCWTGCFWKSALKISCP